MIIDLLKRINDKLDDEYHDQRLEFTNQYLNSLIKIHEVPGNPIDEISNLISLLEKENQLNFHVLIPLIIPHRANLRCIQRWLDLEEYDELFKKVYDIFNLSKAEIKAEQLGIIEEIQPIKKIIDDREYRKAVDDFFWKARLDKDGYPVEINILEDIFELLIRENSNPKFDYQIAKEAEDKAKTSRYDRYNWEFYFIRIDKLIKYDISNIEGSNISFKDYTKSELYSQCGININDYEKKLEFSEALINLFKKYQNFKPAGRGYRIFNPDYKKSDSNNDKPNYNIKPNMPFYEIDKDFFDKQAFLVEKFLTESKKVPISPDMLIIPFKIKNTFYYLTIDNLTESIILNMVNTAFQYINRQSNFFYQIRSVISTDLRNDYDEFESYFLKEIRSNTGYNSKLLRGIYNKNSTRFLTSKYIIPLQIDSDT